MTSKAQIWDTAGQEQYRAMTSAEVLNGFSAHIKAISASSSGVVIKEGPVFRLLILLSLDQRSSQRSIVGLDRLNILAI